MICRVGKDNLCCNNNTATELDLRIKENNNTLLTTVCGIQYNAGEIKNRE